MIDMKKMKNKKFDASVKLLLTTIILSGIVLTGGIGASVDTPMVALKDDSIGFEMLSIRMVPYPIFGTAEYEDHGWAEGANVEVISSEGTLTDTVDETGYWQVDCGDPGPDWSEGTDFTVWIYGIGEYEGWNGTASGTVEGSGSDMGNIILRPWPDLDCEGDLDWVDVPAGGTETGSITVENIGVTGSLLDWEIASEPSWGTWTFDPDGGDDLASGTPLTIDVTVIAPDEKNEDFTGTIRLENKENSEDYCMIDVSLSTPMNKQSKNIQVFQFVQELRQRYLFSR